MLAEKIGCTHATLSQWQTGTTNLSNVKVGLLLAFCEQTGTNLQWLLTGEGPAINAYGREAHPLILKAAELVVSHPELAETAGRLLDALEHPTPA